MTLHCKVFIDCSEHILTMVQVLDDKLTPQRFSALLLGIFAGVALLLRCRRNVQRGPWSARVMKTLVFGVSASDPLTLAAVAATLAFVALMASLVPAYRALRLDPVKALHAE